MAPVKCLLSMFETWSLNNQHQFHDCCWVLIFLLLFMTQRFSFVYDSGFWSLLEAHFCDIGVWWRREIVFDSLSWDLGFGLILGQPEDFCGGLFIFQWLWFFVLRNRGGNWNCAKMNKKNSYMQKQEPNKTCGKIVFWKLVSHAVFKKPFSRFENKNQNLVTQKCGNI